MEFYGGYQVYSESGIDLTLLTERLKMTMTERLAGERPSFGGCRGFPQCQTRSMPNRFCNRW